MLFFFFLEICDSSGSDFKNKINNNCVGGFLFQSQTYHCVFDIILNFLVVGKKGNKNNMN